MTVNINIHNPQVILSKFWEREKNAPKLMQVKCW